MTRPTARVLALLEILQAGGTRTVGELAARLDVDERTVRRYVAHLADLDVPVESLRGRYGGVRLVPGRRVPPLMFTDEEALAVLLGLVAGRRAGLVTTSVVAVESAAAKLRRVLPVALARRLEAVLETAAFTAAPLAPATPGTEILIAVAEAARDHRALALDYTDSRGVRSSRTVHPYGIVAHSGRWYLTGADPADGEVRAFRVDRVEGVQPLPGTFEVPVGFDRAAVVLAAIAGAPRRHTVSLLVEGSADHVRALFPSGIATVEEGPDSPHMVRVLIQAERLDWVPGLLAGIDCPFWIEGPDALRPLVRELAQRVTAAANGTP
ncbi:YafY family transcriptional regulator [Modestobacter sp. L9-4]|uniref:helix-turn-helix transcriptional regulator n=1 Tax=Modestobacter sp. L9-4 TaxID=2851567 RepID=UPI001C77DED2|nr:YafY family protein [Modestobacter sp. L9-4]QXG77453.1 YafY family transcriptional regulator [Modestobacter sp. L9-4]